MITAGAEAELEEEVPVMMVRRCAIAACIREAENGSMKSMFQEYIAKRIKAGELVVEEGGIESAVRTLQVPSSNVWYGCA